LRRPAGVPPGRNADVTRKDARHVGLVGEPRREQAPRDVQCAMSTKWPSGMRNEQDRPRGGHGRVFLGAAAFLFMVAFLIWAFVAHNVVITCDRATDSCQAVELRNVGTPIHRFRLSDVMRVYVERMSDKRGKPAGDCLALQTRGREPLFFCGPDDEEIEQEFNRFLKDPAEPRFEAVVKGALVGYFYVWTAGIFGSVSLVLGLILRLMPRRKRP
jgi:hypothetical protein